MDLCRLLESVVNDLHVITKVTHLLKSSWNYVIVLFSIFGTVWEFAVNSFLFPFSVSVAN